MWKVSNTQTVKAPAPAVWQRWTEVSKWPDQDETLASAAIDGPFAVGSTITLKPKNSPTVKVVLTEVKPNQTFSTVGSLPLAKLHFVHSIQASSAGVQFTQSVAVEGPLAGLYAKLMGKKMEQSLKDRMFMMVKLIEKKKF